MMHQPVRNTLLGTCWALVLVLTACGAADDRLAGLVPGLAPATADALTRPDLPAFAAYADAVSGDRLLEDRDLLVGALYDDDRPAADDDRALLRRALAAVDSVLDDGLGMDEYRVETADLAARPPAGAARVLDRQRRFVAIFSDTEDSPAQRIAVLDTIHAAMLSDGDVAGTLMGWDMLAVLRHRQGDWEGALDLHRRGWAYAGRHDHLVGQCLSWTQLMQYAMRRGWSAAEQDTIRQLEGRARRARLARMASMLMSLQAYGAANQGRYSSARIHFEDGIAWCNEMGEHARALPTYDFLLRMYAVLECWNQVDKHLVVAEQLATERSAADGAGNRIGAGLGRVRHAILAARSLAARGEADAAHAAFADAFATSTDLVFAEVGYYGQQWIDAMIANDRPDLAAAAVAVVGEYAHAHGTRHVLLRLPFWEAWLAWQDGDRAAALAHLDTFAADGLHDRMVRDNLGLREAALRACAVGSTDPAAGARILAAGWGDLFQRIHGGEAGPEAYLDLGRNSHLRFAAHDLLGDDPAAAYGLELLWRRALLRRWPVPEDPAGHDLATEARHLATQARARLAAEDAVHCLYQVRRDRVVRFTADAHAVVRTDLEVSPAALRAEVLHVLELLGSDPGTPDAPVSAALADALAGLARRVLPPHLFNPSARPRTLLVSGESFLAQVPFAPLNLGGPDTYQPLVELMDVAWTRGGPGLESSADAVGGKAANSLIVAGPTLDPATRRRFQLPAGLPGAEAEAVAVAQWIPAPQLVAGDAATPERVRAAWGDAEVLYFLGHAVRDAEVPLTSWLPLAASAGAGAYPGLDLKDIVSAHLDRCRLVVLSGCATGAPYVDGLSTTPSLGDAFLDAGADAAVQTYWRVRDEGSVFRPDRVLAAWRHDGRTLVAAVSDEQRRCLRGPAGYRHPFSWAAWTLKTNGF
jgi:hypothetical protein